MISPSVTNPSISDIYQQIKREELILQPSFQRKFVWTTEHQEAFLETIQKGLPFPEIYVCQGKSDLATLKTTKDVIDGQQRLTTIQNYLDDNYYVDGKYKYPFKEIKPFRELNEKDQRQFIEYKVVFRDLGRIDADLTREIFRRINMTEFKLDDIEIQNAIYDGEFIQTAKNVLDQFDLKEYGVLKESEFTRMADLHYILLIMATLENGGYFPNNNGLEKRVAEFNNSYPNSIRMEEALLETFAVIKKLELPFDSVWFRKSSFFTLSVEISKILFNELDLIDSVDSSIQQLKTFIYSNDFKSRLEEFSDNVLINRTDIDSEYYDYYWSTYQGTNSRNARVLRSEYFQRYCLKI